MPLEVDLTGCCGICYLPLIAGPTESQGYGKVCPWDASHTPRVRLTGRGPAEELLVALSPDLRLERPIEAGGPDLRVGAELLVADGQAFRARGGGGGSCFEAFDPPDTREALAAALEECGWSAQLTFRNARPASARLLAPSPPRPGEGGPAAAAGAGEDEGVVLLPARDAPRRRRDPEDGRACTWREVQARYSAEMSPDDLYWFWCHRCRSLDDDRAPVLQEDSRGGGGGPLAGTGAGAVDGGVELRDSAKGRGRGRGKGRGRAEAFAAPSPAEGSWSGGPRVREEAFAAPLQAEGSWSSGSRVREEAEGSRSGGPHAREEAADARAAPAREALNGRHALDKEVPNGRPAPAGGGAPSLGRARCAQEVPNGRPAAAEEAAASSRWPAPAEEPRRGAPAAGSGGASNGRPPSASEVQASGGGFDAAAWLREVEVGGFLAPYAEAMSARFGSLAELQRSYRDGGKEQFYKLVGVTKLGHKRLIDRIMDA